MEVEVTTPRQSAFILLGITEEMLLVAPRITVQMRSIARTIKGKRNAPYGPGADLPTSWPNYLDISEDPQAAKVRFAYYGIPKYLRRHLPIEAYCVAVGVSPLRILEILVSTIVRMSAQSSAVIAAVNHPRVAAKTVEMALTDDGIEDRKVLHTHTGFLPQRAGARTSIVVQQNATATAQAASVAAPPPEQTIRRLADRFNLARTLPEQVTTPMPERPVEAEVVEVEAEDVLED